MPLIYRGEDLLKFDDLFTDESRLLGTPSGLAIPETVSELQAVLATCDAREEAVTVSAGLTGITGGGVPCEGVAVSLRKLDRITGLRREGDGWLVTVEPGVMLSDLRDSLRRKNFPHTTCWSSESLLALNEFNNDGDWIFPTDPTESSACLGGMAACNASGARSFHYGPFRNYVTSLRGMLADGCSFSLKRGESICGADRSFCLKLDNGEEIRGKLPSYEMPKGKNAAGYFAADGADLVDLLVGSEGTLAVLTEIELRLVLSPEEVLGLIAFASSEQTALRFVHELRGEGKARLPARPLALEYFDHLSLDLLRRQREQSDGASEIPLLPDNYHTAVYVEFGGDSEVVQNCAEVLVELLDSLGICEDATWMATEAHEHERLKNFRHAIPEAVNQKIGQIRRTYPCVTKLGTDLAVPDDKLDQILSFYRRNLDEAGLTYVVFGHIGDNHFHVNIIPHDEAEYARGKVLYLDFARQVVDWGGTVSAEHGLGKLKTFMLPVLYGAAGVEEMKATKAAFDPKGLLNPGTLF